MRTTTVVHWNKGQIAEKHNERDEELCKHEKHIDYYNRHGDSYHEELCRQDLSHAYEEVFGDAIEEYNAKQKRKDRRLTVDSYMESVENDNRGKKQTKKVNGKSVVDEDAERVGKQVVYEFTSKVGNTERERDANGCVLYDANGHHIRPEELPRELQAEILREQYRTFEDANPNFKLVSCDLHADEGFENKRGVWEYSEIHTHYTIIPVATGFKQGLSVQNSMNKALEQMGCGGNNGYHLWAEKEQDRLANITLEKYKEYCKTHLDFYKEHGDLEIYRPVKEKSRKGDMNKEQYIKEQELAEREGDVKSQEIALQEWMYEQIVSQAEEYAWDRDELELKRREQEADLEADRIDVMLNSKQNACDREQIECDRKLLQSWKDELRDDRHHIILLYDKLSRQNKIVDELCAQVKLLLTSTEQFKDEQITRRDDFMSRINYKDGRNALQMFQAKEKREKDARFKELDRINTRQTSIDWDTVDVKLRNKIFAEMKRNKEQEQEQER